LSPIFDQNFSRNWPCSKLFHCIGCPVIV
jgi:hypothetical protein